MKYYTDTIPPTLAEKLKEKGMPSDYGCNQCEFLPPYERTDIIPYGFAFDWLMEKGILIIIKPYWTTNSWESYVIKMPETDMPKAAREIYVHPTWHEAANAAIEKVLELI